MAAVWAWRKTPDHETGKLSDLGTVPAPGSFHGMHEPQGHRRRKSTLRSRLGHCAPRRPYRTHWRAPRPFTGLIEACLKTQYPDDFARIIEITYRFSYGWRRIHNPDSGEDVADDLTTTEFTMAMLACRGWTNAEIARHMGVSPGTVKNRLSGVYAKLGIGTRAELVAHMLR